jgi:predicted ArsR family transcriptional regulator
MVNGQNGWEGPVVEEDLEQQAAGIAALAEPARRALYAFVSSQPGPVSREQAAEHTGLPLHSVKFHLDRLVEQDLLDVEFRRLSGRSGPGAGRPAKLYRRSDRQLSVSIPARSYDLVGDVLAEGVDRSVREGVPVKDAVHAAALAHGRRLGAAAAAEAAVATDSGAPEDERTEQEHAEPKSTELERAAQVLAGSGYEPRVVGADVVLANCPFDRLARDHTELVCGLNLALVDGMLQGLGCTTLQAVLDPRPGRCCVTTRARARTTA